MGFSDIPVRQNNQRITSSWFNSIRSELIANDSTQGMQTFADDAAYVAAKGEAVAEGDYYLNTTLDLMRYYTDGAWSSQLDEDSAQTITNKTFDDSLIVKESGIPSTPATGYQKIYPKTNNLWYTMADDGIETEIGSGAGGGSTGINFCTNPDAEENADDWYVYNDESGEKPDGTDSGSTTVQISRITAGGFVLRGDGSFNLSKPASNAQGEGFATNFTIDYVDRNSMVDFSMDYTFDLFDNYNDGDVVFYIYDIINAKIIEFPDGALQAVENGSIKISFQATDSLQYRLYGHVATTHTNQFAIRFDNVRISPAAPATFGTPSTDWESFTPTGTWTTNTTYTGLCKRIGDELEVAVKVALAGAPNSTDLIIDMPNGLVIDSDKVIELSNRNIVGSATYRDAGSLLHYYGSMNIDNSTTIRAMELTDSGVNEIYNFVGSTSPFTWANGDYAILNFKVPIDGWSSNVAMSETTSNREVAFKARLSANQAITASGNVLLELDTVLEDNLNAWDQGSYSYIIPESGVYSLSGLITSSGISTAGYAGLQIYKGSSRLIATLPYESNARTSSSATVIEQCSKGDIIKFYSSSDDSGYSVYGGTTLRTMFSIHKNSGSQTITASEKVFVDVEDSSGQSVTDGNTLTWNSVNTDTHGIYSGGVFTMPRSGIMSLTAATSTGGVTASVGNSYGLYVKINNASEHYGKRDVCESATSRGYDAGITFKIVVFKGDTVEIVFSESLPSITLGAASRNRASILLN